MVLRPGKEEEAKAIFRKWGLDFAIIGRTTDTRRFVVSHQGEVMADMPIKELGDEAPLYDRPFVKPPARAAVEAKSVDAPGSAYGGAAPPPRLARSLLQALGLGAIRPSDPGQHRAAAGRRRRDRAGRGRAEGAGAHLRRDAPLCGGRSLSRAASRRSRKPGATSPPSARSRWRSPTISISAIPSGPRSWGSSSSPYAASPMPAAASISRSSPAMSRSTTRRAAARSCRPRPSAGSASSPM